MEVKKVYRSGFYTPITLGGNIIVNGVVASAHSEWFLEPYVPKSLSRYLPATYQAMLLPARVIYHLVGPKFARDFDENYDVPHLVLNYGFFGYVYAMSLAIKDAVFATNQVSHDCPLNEPKPSLTGRLQSLLMSVKA